MEVIYPKACGVDVHKTFIVAVICDSTNQIPKYLKKRFSTFNNSLIDFRNWLLNNDCQNVCMESTGKYYIPVYNALEGFISNVVVANLMSSLPILNGLSVSKVRKTITRMQNGLQTCLS